jgi:tRNA pseudouridine55 synthase
MKIVAIYKDAGLTSHDVVEKIKRITGVTKVGHAGTLDPLARGVLVIAIGRSATKMLKEIVDSEKEYLAEIKLGETSETDDQEGKKIKATICKPPSLEQIKKVLKGFEGKISQKPPLYSAVKVKGKPAYFWARKGKKIELKKRMVEIKQIEVLDYEWPLLKLRVITGPGAYIRSLARDLGERLGTGAYLFGLERIRVGQFSKTNSLSLSGLEGQWQDQIDKTRNL